ncbi:MAG: galactose mutarotase [Opitutaceae bacterium]|nr:galactose mutarotase [Opitutaceae bacterium]
MSSTVQKLPFGQVTGKPVDLFVLTNGTGSIAKICTYGATLTELHVPDRQGRLGDVVLGFDTLAPYLGSHPFLGATIGRVANRIARGRFTLGGKNYSLAINNPPNHLHGGPVGFDRSLWSGATVPASDGVAVKFSLLSPDGDQGFPGNCRVEVTYTLTESNVLRIEYSATVDRDCPVNLTNHSYFNLAGAAHGLVLDHELQLNADMYTPVDATSIPLGQLAPVAGTPMDFRQPTRVGAHLREVGSDPCGYDHNYAVNGGGRGLTFVGRVYEPTSGRVMETRSTEPGVQFYTSNYFDGSVTGKGGVVYRQHHALCLETQHFPDAVNQPAFASCVRKAGETFRTTTEYAFSTR